MVHKTLQLSVWIRGHCSTLKAEKNKWFDHMNIVAGTKMADVSSGLWFKVTEVCLTACVCTFAASLGRSKGIRWRTLGGSWLRTSAFRRRIMIWLRRWCSSSRLEAPRQSHCLRGPKYLQEIEWEVPAYTHTHTHTHTSKLAKKTHLFTALPWRNS